MNNKDFKLYNLKEIREKNNLTQLRVSIDVEVSQELISQYERGISLPTVQNLVKLASFFNCSTDYLLGLTNNPNRITDLSKKEFEINTIIDKYSSLSIENKKHLINYLDFLIQN